MDEEQDIEGFHEKALTAVDNALLKAASMIEGKFSQIDATSKEKEFLLRHLVGADVSPRGWKITTVAPYYKSRYAKELQIILDKMFEDKESDQKILYSNFAARPGTLYIRLNQSWKYLCDKLDPDGKYRYMRDYVRIKKEEDGLRLTWLAEEETHKSTVILASEKVAKTPRTKPAYIRDEEWRPELMNYLENSVDRELFHKKELKLTQLTIDEITAIVEQMGDICILKLDRKEIKLFKGTPPSTQLKIGP